MAGVEHRVAHMRADETGGTSDDLPTFQPHPRVYQRPSAAMSEARVFPKIGATVEASSPVTGPAHVEEAKEPIPTQSPSTETYRAGNRGDFDRLYRNCYPRLV